MVRFAVTIFLSAFLLFQIQPMIGKYILSWFGGTAGVWTTCMLFFQVLLLLGYAYAHLLSSRVPWKMQGWIHLGMLAVAVIFLPIGPDADVWKPQSADNPAGRILFMLLVNIGLPYFLLSATGPLLQSWFSGAYPGRSPYRLYSLSNFGSLLALASYPLVFEPIAGVSTHVVWWSWGFVAFLLACGWCALRVTNSEHALHGGQDDPALAAVEGQPVPQDDMQPTAMRPNIGLILMWVTLAASASAMLLATTNQLTQEVASVPFLWVIPLILYLLSFIICFDNERWYSRRFFGGLLLATTPLVVVVLFMGVEGKLWVQIAVYSMALFACCMTCHGELVKTKPDPKHLTLFYLTVSAGGAIGGAFVALVAPNVFNGYYEFHFALITCVAVTFLAWFIQRNELDEKPVLSIRYGLVGLVALFVFVSATMISEEPFAHWPWESVKEKDAANAFFPSLWRHINEYKLDVDLGGMEFSIHLLLVLIVVWITLRAALFVDRHFLRTVRMPLLCWAGAPLAVLMLCFSMRNQATSGHENTIYLSRNFYGVMRVKEFDKNIWLDDLERAAREPDEYRVNKNDEAYIPMGMIRRLIHGRILHGIQFQDADKKRWHTSYYSENSGVGLAMTRHPNRLRLLPNQRNMRIGLIGLGTGTIATYADLGDYLRIYEINPEVETLAALPNDSVFTHIADSPAKIDVVLGDARIQLELEKKRGEENNFDVLIVDAFSSDSIPLHLLTKECVQLYFDHLNNEEGEEGLLAIHISNIFVDLNPIVRALGEEFNCEVIRVKVYDDEEQGISGSTWVVLTKNKQFIEDQVVKKAMDPYDDEKTAPVLWTDDRTSLWKLLKF